MCVKLLAIKFNHDPQSATNDALNIRRNVKESVDVPEWRRGLSKPEDSPAAYALRETKGNKITIQAQFSTIEFYNKTIEIRAVELPGGTPVPWWLVLFFIWLLLLLRLPIPFNVLGRVAPTQVTFGPNGDSDFVSFELSVPLWNTPFVELFCVGIFLVDWRWQWRQVGGTWKDFDTSRHRIYTLLKVPQGPWEQVPGSIQMPWVDAMDYACQWATGAITTEIAARQITEGLNHNPLLYYEPGTFFCTGFPDGTYLLSSFLGQLSSGQQFPLNCRDCANAMTTFANLVGCDLWEGVMSDLQTRKILGIGGNPADDSDWRVWDWGWHEVAWLEVIGDNEHLYDACLQLDMDDDYNDQVHIPHLPIAMKFGQNAPNDYRYRLVQNGPCILEGIPRRRSVI